MKTGSWLNAEGNVWTAEGEGDLTLEKTA